MDGSVNQRISRIIENSGMSLTAFAKMIGIAQTSLRDCVKNGAEPKYSTLNKILIAKPLVSAEWLLTGKGDMEKKESSNSELLEELKAEINQLKGENRILREQIGLGERKESDSRSA